MSASSALAGVKIQSFDFYKVSYEEPIKDIFLAQAQTDTSTNQTTLEEEQAEDIDAKFPDELLERFIADAAGFIAEIENAGIIAAVVRQAIARNLSNVDLVIAAVEGLSDTVALAAVADGIVRAAADYAAAGDAVASSQILAKGSISTSSTLRQAVQTKISEVATEIASVAGDLQNEGVVVSENEASVTAQENVTVEETSTLSFDVEILSTPDNGAPTLATTTAATGDAENSVVLGSGNTQSPPASPTPQSQTNPPSIVTPPAADSPASPA